LNRKNRQRLPTSDDRFEIVVTDDNSQTLRDKDIDQTFHSESGALSESLLVFLENSAIRERLDAGGNEPCHVLEIGLGTGMNFLVTADHALKATSPLRYSSLDVKWLPIGILRQLNPASFLHSKGLVDAWYRAMESASASDKNLVSDSQENIFFEFFKADAAQFDFEAIKPTTGFDAIYLDAFSPEANPLLWTKDFFSVLISLLRKEGRLVTYCVKSEIQRRLREVGFNVSKTRGPANWKREVLVAKR